MKLTRHRALFAGVVGVAAVVVPISVPFVANQLASGASSSTLASPDVITYNQTTGSAGTYIQYVPAGNPANATTQTATPSGRCGTPTVTGTPILGLSGLLYPPDRDIAGQPDTNDYSGSPSPVPVGSYRQHTGVCAVDASWQIDNEDGRGQEALDFSTLGANSVIGTNRIFSDAQIQIQSEYEWWHPSSVPVTLVEYLGGSQVASVNCTIPTAGSTITADTATNASCTGTTPIRGFDTVEIQVPVDETSVSVVGTSTFTLAPQVCGGQSITSSGPITATLNIANGSGCQSYTSFTSSNSGGNQNLTYDAYAPGAPVPFTFVIPWAPQLECQPGNDLTVNNTTTPLPECAPTQVTLDGTTYTDQTYCAAPSTGQPLCTESKTFNYVTVGAATDTQINETWGGLIDWAIRH